MKHFKLSDFEKTNHKVDNTLPNEVIKKDIEEFITELLDPLTDDWNIHCEKNDLGVGVIGVNSGYRGDELNKLVNGSLTSAHSHGLAADIRPMNGHMNYFQNYIKQWLIDKNYDQLIWEDVKEDGISSWIHIGYRQPKTENFRKMNLIKYKGKKGYFPM